MKKATLINKGYLGFHLVGSTGKAHEGREKPFKLLETRTVDPTRVRLCCYGYHWTDLPSTAALHYDFGPIIEFCLFSPPLDHSSDKYVSSSKMVIATANISVLKNKLDRKFLRGKLKASVEKQFNKDVYKALGLKFGRGE